jgi:hypothetical protein
MVAFEHRRRPFAFAPANVLEGIDAPLPDREDDILRDRISAVKHMFGVQHMSFRQQNKNPDTAWRRRSRQELRATGLPDFVVDDERRWIYVLLHGDDLESGWSPEWITKEQAAALLSLLQLHYENRIGLDLFATLEKRLDAGLDT